MKCAKHGVVVAAVPWARRASGFTRSFEDTVAWLAVRTDKTTLAGLLKLAWRTVGAIVDRVSVEARRAVDPFENVRRIGIDEVSYRKGHQYLTVVVDHDTFAPGNHCTAGMVALPGMAEDLFNGMLRLRREHALDDIVTVFHSCQRALCVHDGFEGMGVVNFVKYLATSMGIPCGEDLYRQWKTAGGADDVRRAVGLEVLAVLPDRG